MGKVYICLRYDDFGLKAEATEYDRQLIRMADETNGKITISIVPHSENCKKNRDYLFDSVFFRAVKNGKIEIAVHGYKHCRNFAEKLLHVHGEFGKKPYFMQKRDIKNGLSEWKNDLNLPVTHIFVPPQNVYDKNTVEILAENGFSMISDGRNCDNAFKGDAEKAGISRVPFTCGIEASGELADELLKKDGEYILVALFHHYNYPIEKVLELEKFYEQKNVEFITLSEIQKKLSSKILDEFEASQNKYYRLD